MVKRDGSWKLELNLPVGFHHYKFVVDGEWVIDTTKPSTGRAPDLLNVLEVTSAPVKVRRDRSHETILAQTNEDLLEALETSAKLKLGDQLDQIHLSHTSLTASCLAPLFACLQGNKTVHTLNLSNTPLGDGLAKPLSALLAQNSLRVLNLWNVNLTDAGASEISASLTKNTSLVTLNLRANAIGPAGAQALASAVLKHPALSLVDLWWNPVGDKGAGAWAQVAREGKVKELHLGGNDLELGSATKKLWQEALKSSKSLQSLHFLSFDRRPFTSTSDKLSD